MLLHPLLPRYLIEYMQPMGWLAREISLGMKSYEDADNFATQSC